ncbi:hypothetical protein [Mesorhizobium comanense]|uniref:hypothetical protein n=1 Tax=Mesorhizobium comanense TaxID=2502215 RepID=UPI0010F69F10|nr:hypothetical protein [Mesorhizobium comanense]
MERDQQHSVKHRPPIVEFKSVEELYEKGELSRRRESNFAVYVTPLVARAIVIVLIFSPESRALAIEIGARAIEIGKERVLRGLLE